MTSQTHRVSAQKLAAGTGHTKHLHQKTAGKEYLQRAWNMDGELGTVQPDSTAPKRVIL